MAWYERQCGKRFGQHEGQLRRSLEPGLCCVLSTVQRWGDATCSGETSSPTICNPIYDEAPSRYEYCRARQCSI